jgi:hypothetical protein
MRRRPFLLGLLALLCTTLVAGAAMPAGAGGSRPPEVPVDIQIPAGNKVVLDVTGKGVQIYTCPASGTWTLREPAAVLSGHRHRPVGIHFAGPTFESFDGSGVLGAPDGSVPAPGQKAIPWLRLKAVETEGDGVLAGVTYVHRIETQGGLAPKGTCDPAGDSTVAVPYRARYVFYAAA